MKNTLKWKPAKIIYPTDHIISSKAREVGTWGFKPHYENARHVNMRFIMSNEYMRLWFKERDVYQKENYAKQEKAQNDSRLKRAYVQRMMTNPKRQTRELPIIQLKRFQNISPKIETGKSFEEKAKICGRYQKTFEPPPLSRYKPGCITQKQGNEGYTGNIKSSLPKQKKVKTSLQAQRKDDNEDDTENCQMVCKLI